MSHHEESDDIDFFAQFSDVVPLKQNTIEFVPPTKDSIAKQARRQNIELSMQLANNHLSLECFRPLDPYDHLTFKKSGVQDGVFKNLRMGKYKIEGVVNLQNQKFEQARNVVFTRINEAYKNGSRTLLIKHGIGLHSKPVPAMLKSYVNQWLQEMPQVIAFHTAMAHHGGNGASYVLLKKNDEQKAENREFHRKR
ncbi:DNA endonuclease SmrA [Paraglaciecola sp.]|uniref:DNA endonuclease SmrA n=1 Tax=Paraglaciecola sp. TaxID=1920173 RepID=UPI00273E7FD4|nr:DNA endonuclease SmrA [Paraglaciecola sp.]MDP5032450.1 DNA endonuclease SmrA [Paraglaciecola sp.]